jgi:protein-L-isoaspartate(D-aspartate) O-methyltransferase
MNDQTQRAVELARRMVREQIAGRGIGDQRVLEAMLRVPRHRFVPRQPMEEAYADRAMPTASGQTISQPYMVARMTELLAVEPGQKVLEIGTGSGYQAAVLLALGAKLTTIERYEELAAPAEALLRELYPEAEMRVVVGDGSLGYPDAAPYDRILATCGAPDLPDAYRQQLADPGRIVIPTGERGDQILMVYEQVEGQWKDTHDIGCRFVPLVGEQGWLSAF